MEHRASTRARHLTLLFAVPFVSFHVRFFLSSSAILVRLQVCWGLPLFRFPCGFHSSALLATCPCGLQHSFPCSYPQPPTRVPPHFTYSQNTNTISLHLFYHLSTLTSLKQCPYVPLPNLHTRFWRQQFHRRFMRHSLLRTLFQPGVRILYPCFPTGCSGNSNFGFCNKFLFPGAGYQPAAQPPTWRTRSCSSSGLYPSPNPAWLDLPGTTVPAGTALRVIETHKLHHHDKVSAHGAEHFMAYVVLKL